MLPQQAKQQLVEQASGQQVSAWHGVCSDVQGLQPFREAMLVCGRKPVVKRELHCTAQLATAVMRVTVCVLIDAIPVCVEHVCVVWLHRTRSHVV